MISRRTSSRRSTFLSKSASRAAAAVSMPAVQVGRRHGSDVVVLRVDARRAWKEDVPFYRGNDSTWLADPIPPAYLTLE